MNDFLKVRQSDRSLKNNSGSANSANDPDKTVSNVRDFLNGGGRDRPRKRNNNTTVSNNTNVTQNNCVNTSSNNTNVANNTASAPKKSRRDRVAGGSNDLSAIFGNSKNTNSNANNNTIITPTNNDAVSQPTVNPLEQSATIKSQKKIPDYEQYLPKQRSTFFLPLDKTQSAIGSMVVDIHSLGVLVHTKDNKSFILPNDSKIHNGLSMNWNSFNWNLSKFKEIDRLLLFVNNGQLQNFTINFPEFGRVEEYKSNISYPGVVGFLSIFVIVDKIIMRNVIFSHNDVRSLALANDYII